MTRYERALLLLFMTGCFPEGTLLAQLRPLRAPKKSISISYSALPQGASPNFTAVLGTNADATQGVSYNNGAALSYKVSSDRTYNITISAEDGGSATSGSGRPVDVREYIYYSVVENRTGGESLAATGFGPGTRLGSREQTIIANCPPTNTGALSPMGEEESRAFSLAFKIVAGYSIPPGTYVTNVLVTASYE